MKELEQLKALYLGAKIKVLKVDHHSWGVDTQSDIAIVEELIAKKGERVMLKIKKLVKKIAN